MYHKNTEDNWHALEAGQVLSMLETNAEAGLSHEEAKNRLHHWGRNILPEKKKQSLVFRFLKHFNDIMIYVLFVAAIVAAALGHAIDTVVIILVAVINASIGFFQENKAEKALENIKAMLCHLTQVIRGGERREIDASVITVGDLVILGPGDKIPADLRLLRSDSLRVEESPLTGESVPVEKQVRALDMDTMLGDRKNMAFSSTTVSAGTGLGVVVAIGQDTEIGKINQMISEVEPVTTPLIRQTRKFSTTVSIVILAIAAASFIFGHYLRDYDSEILLLSVIGLALAAIPEGLPAILSVILAIGVQNMAKRKAIVNNLPSVETLGSVTVICSDKTGTLTKNEMTVKTVVTKDQEFYVSGNGYAPDGKVCVANGQPLDFSGQHVLTELIGCFRICNDAALGTDKHGNLMVKGDPTEGALITLFEKADIDHTPVERISTIPFDSEYKYMAVLVAGERENTIYLKGAPDRLLDMAEKQCAIAGVEPFDRAYWEEEISLLASRGQRIIGAACKRVPLDKTSIGHSDIVEGVLFLGLAGIIDPPREEAISSVAACKQAGITVKMITGDHVGTAKAIGLELGIGNGEYALEGKDLDAMNKDEFKRAALECDIFARTSPGHKLKLVNALQAGGAVCAMTGDGVNDAPAIRQADVGVAMGIKGTEVTKDAAEMVLLDDNFSTIVAAVEEGRRVYDNLKKTILFILPTNGAESVLIMASILFGTAMPLLPVQILWVNMVTSITVSLALAFEKIEPGAMSRKPRSPKTPLLDNYAIWRILFVSLLIGGATWLMDINLYKSGYGYSREIISTITLQAIVLCQMFHLFNSRNISAFAINKDFFGNRAVFVVCGILIALQLSISYIPFMNHVFGTAPLPLEAWGFPLALGFAVFIIVEIEKLVVRKLKLYPR